MQEAHRYRCRIRHSLPDAVESDKARLTKATKEVQAPEKRFNLM